MNLFYYARFSASKVVPYQVFTGLNYPYLQNHSGVPGTEIATLKHAVFIEPLGGEWWSELPGLCIHFLMFKYSYLKPHN